MKIHYFDNCASTQVDDEILDIIAMYSRCYYYNPSALGSYSALVNKAMQDSRLTVAECLGADKSEIVFTSGGTESNNIAILSSISGKKGNIVLTACEHSSVYYTISNLSKDDYEVRIAHCDDQGHIDKKHYLSLVDDRTIMACMMHINNNTGAINDIYTLCKGVKSINSNTIVMCDGVQAVGKMHVNVKHLGIDLYTMSGHKIHTTKGVGALYIKKGTKMTPIYSGGSQEYGIRTGTENVPANISLGVAVKNAVSSIDVHNDKYIQYRQTILTALSKIDDCHINCCDNCLDCVLSIAISGIKAEVLIHMLEQYGIIVGTSSACSAKNARANRSFWAMGLNTKYYDGVLRISFSKYTTQDSVELLAEKLPILVAQLRKTMRR